MTLNELKKKRFISFDKGYRTSRYSFKLYIERFKNEEISPNRIHIIVSSPKKLSKEEVFYIGMFLASVGAFAGMLNDDKFIIYIVGEEKVNHFLYMLKSYGNYGDALSNQ